jgi:hypothetical protein
VLINISCCIEFGGLLGLSSFVVAIEVDSTLVGAVGGGEIMGILADVGVVGVVGVAGVGTIVVIAESADTARRFSFCLKARAVALGTPNAAPFSTLVVNPTGCT